MGLLQRYRQIWPQLPGIRHILIVTAWGALTLITVGMTIAGISLRSKELFQTCSKAPIWLAAGTCTSLLLGTELLFAAGFILMAIVPIWFRPKNLTAAFLAFTLVAFSVTQAEMVRALARAHPVLETPFRLLVCIAAVGALTIVYTFPDGRFVPDWTRLLAFAWAIFVTVGLLWREMPANPVYADIWQSTLWLSALVALGWFGVGAVGQFIRYRQGVSPPEKRKIRWTVAGLLTALIGGLVAYLPITVLLPFSSVRMTSTLLYIVQPMLAKLLLLCAPVCITVAVVYRRLWDVPSNVSRLLHWLLMTIVVISLYIVVVTILSLVLSSANDTLSIILTTAIIGVLFHPLRERSQRAINHVIYGSLHDSAELLGILGQRLQQTMALQDILPSIVKEIRQALKVPYVAIELAQHDQQLEFVSTGEPDRDILRLPLTYNDKPMGTLLIGYYGPDEHVHHNKEIERTLKLLAIQAGNAVYIVYLMRKLQSLNTMLAQIAFEEQRNIRDRLHDSLLDDIRRLIEQLDPAYQKSSSNVSEPDTIRLAALDSARQLRATANEKIRGIYPPVLDLGLKATLENRIQAFEHDSLQIVPDVPPGLPKFHPAVMKTVYDITTNALSNVRRHSDANRCVIVVQLTHELCLDIIDFGRGIDPQYQPGIGLLRMQRSAEALGGSCRIEPALRGGTAVRVRLPIWLEGKEWLP